MRRWRTLICGSLALLACDPATDPRVPASASPAPAPPTSTGAPTLDPPPAPLDAPAPDVAPTRGYLGGRPVEGSMRTPITAEDEARAQTFEGRFDIDRVPGGKRLQASRLTTDSGAHYLLSYRPMPEHFDKVERRVIVRAVRYYPSGQHVYADHLKVVSMTLAASEAAIDPPPTRLPSPPEIRRRADLRPRVGLWARVHGDLVARKRDRRIRLRLADGTIVPATTPPLDSLFDRPENVGLPFTLLGKLVRTERGLLLTGTALCFGEDDDLDACRADAP